MISEAVAFLREELSRYIVANQKDAGSITNIKLRPEDIMLGNIATLDNDQEGKLKNKVIVTLVNIEEESTLKNGKLYYKNPLSNGIEYLQTPVYLNLYLLFCATLPDSGGAPSDNYERALERLGLVIQFFQAKKSFTIQNSPLSTFSSSEDRQILEELRLLPELYTLTFEQINHLWGSLGGKQVPFAMYKVRLVQVGEPISREAPVIEEIQRNDEYLSKSE